MVQVWKIAPGRGAENWDLFREHGCIGLGWLEDADYRDYGSEDQVLAALEAKHGKGVPGASAGSAKMIFQFVRDVTPQHVIIANDGYNRVVGVGVVAGDYLSPNSALNPIRTEQTHRRHVRQVNWHITEPVDLPGKRFFVQSTLSLLRDDQVNGVRQAYAAKSPRLLAAFDQMLLGDQAGTSGVTELSVAEGRELLRLHRTRERSRVLVARKKRSVLSESGRLVCEACEFDFEMVYGSRGYGFAECHHTIPISQSSPGRRTALSELAVVCSNCHRMLHRRPWVSVPKLRELVRSRRDDRHRSAT